MKKQKRSSPVTRTVLKRELTIFEKRLRMDLASKDDLKLLEKRLRTDLASKADLQVFKTELKSEFKSELLKEIMEGVKFLNEQLVYDFLGIFKDRTEQLRDRIGDHEDRIQRLETRMIAA